MADLIEVTGSEKFIGRLSHESDLLEEIGAVCRKYGVRFGRVEAIGAVKCARLAYYDQEKLEYRHFEIKEALEIASLTGNISSRDGETMVHAHLTLADEKGKTYGGHLAPGTIIFAAEILIHSFNEAPLERGLDEETGLPLWTMEGRR